ncbi:hypothetical protein V495_01985 [Pseudogymnoascus sp. VKM F-4514 (FW-929)]|nr:hypothetical protein V495_01985 [Pseudogymnoascus sp. VKM F-4514 (FW-929)]KFY62022.1 hypothetical protein V497_02617 [Pseudogymnoascus sp. VKM F-4516 (FW-969)]
MGKHGTNTGKASKKVKPNTPSKNSSEQSLPSFDESALSALTEKIEKGFNKGASSEAAQKPAKKDKNKPNGASQSKDTAPGKKRDAEGNVKTTAKSNKAAEGSARDILLQEILALGGTEEDLDLVEGVESEDEDVEGTQPKIDDPKFAKEFSKFIAGLGIEGQAQVDASEPEEEVDEADEDSEEWEEEPDTPKKAPKKAEEPIPQLVQAQPEKKSKDVNRLIFEARPDWHAAPLGDLPTPELNDVPAHRAIIEELKKYAKTLLEADSNLYASKHLSSTSSHRFLATIMASGTLDDKVSALTLVIQESPVHTAKSFESLLGLAKKRSRGQAVTALGALKDLLGVGVVLPADRRLRSFATQPGLMGTLQTEFVSSWRSQDPLPGSITKAHLISWAYEDWLKEIYFEILQVLEQWCADEVEFARGRAITYVYELLKEKPEQESNLLRLLVNKLGDPDKKLASRTSYLILQLQTTHPLMKPIIVSAIESELLLRPHQSTHSKYYAINTLNQTILSGKEEAVAQKLLKIYFDLFVTLLKKPVAAMVAPGPVMNKKGQVQGGGGQKGKKALEKVTKEEQAKLSSEETTEKMISAVLTGVNRALPFSKSDDVTLEKHMDLLFKITHSSNFNTSIQALMLIQQLSSSKTIAVERFYRTLYESLLDPRLITSSKHALYLNLLFRALKSDLDVRRVKAFAKRLLQIITLHQPPFICGVLYLLRELETSFPGLTTMITEPEASDDHDEEVFKDVPETETAETEAATLHENLMHPDRIPKPAPKEGLYDGRKRDPEHSNADKSCLWELTPFITHFHPSVAMFADRLLSSAVMPAKPDLASHSLISFLDRFVYRNAKASAGGLRGSSIMQPLAGGESSGVLVANRATAQAHQPVNSEAFWRKKAEDVAVDEVFFHKYFNQVGKGKVAKKGKAAKATEGSDDEDENEDEIWQALVDSRPEVEGPSDDESDLEMLDLDDSGDEGSEGSEAMWEDDDEVDVEGSDEEEQGSEGGEEPSPFLDEDELDEGEDEDEDELFNRELETNKKPEAKADGTETGRAKKKKMKSLPMFASVDDYADMMGGDEDEDMG